MAKTASYEDYVRRLQQINRRMSYKDFAKFRLKDSTDELKTAMKEANAAAYRADRDYGVRAESLSSRGLKDTGYSEYIDSLAKGAAAKAKNDAVGKYENEKREAFSEYDEYNEEYEAAQKKLFDSVLGKFGEHSLKTYDEMFKYAVGAGLSTEYAKTAASTGYAAHLENMRHQVVDLIVRRGIGRKEAYEYALKLGLDESVATELGEYAKRLRENELVSDYLDKFKNKN